MLWVLARGHRDFTALRRWNSVGSGAKSQIPGLSINEVQLFDGNLSQHYAARPALVNWLPDPKVVLCSATTYWCHLWNQVWVIFCPICLLICSPMLPESGPESGSSGTLDILWYFPMNGFPHLLENNPFITHLYEALAKTPPYPLGSMYAIYGNIYHQYTPNVSIYTSTMDPMGFHWWFSASSPRNVPRYTAPKPPEPKTWR